MNTGIKVWGRILMVERIEEDRSGEMTEKLKLAEPKTHTAKQMTCGLSSKEGG